MDQPKWDISKLPRNTDLETRAILKRLPSAHAAFTSNSKVSIRFMMEMEERAG